MPLPLEEKSEVTTGKHGDKGRYVTTENGSQIFLTQDGQIGQTGKSIDGEMSWKPVGQPKSTAQSPAPQDQSGEGDDSFRQASPRPKSFFVQSFADSIIENIRKFEREQQQPKAAAPNPQDHPHAISKLPIPMRQSLLNWEAEINTLTQTVGRARHGARGNDPKGVMKAAFDQIDKTELGRVMGNLQKLIAVGDQQGVNLRPFIRHNNLVPRELAPKLKPSDLFNPVQDSERYRADSPSLAARFTAVISEHYAAKFDESKHARDESGQFATIESHDTPAGKVEIRHRSSKGVHPLEGMKDDPAFKNMPYFEHDFEVTVGGKTRERIRRGGDSDSMDIGIDDARFESNKIRKQAAKKGEVVSQGKADVTTDDGDESISWKIEHDGRGSFRATVGDWYSEEGLGRKGAEKAIKNEIDEHVKANSMQYAATQSDVVIDRLIAAQLGITVEQYAARKAKNSPGQMSLFGDGLGGDSPLRTASRQQRLDWDESRVKRDDDGKFAEKAEAKADGVKNSEQFLFGKRSGDTKVIAGRLFRKLKEEKHISIVGQKVSSMEELAELAQIYRDPRFETFRAFFVKDGKVIGHNAYTSREPGLVYVPQKVNDKIASDLQKFSADGFYLLHNHPSGNPLPSNEDILMTKKFHAEFGDKLLGHTIINHNKGTVISPSGKTSDYELKNDNLNAKEMADIPGDILDEAITGVTKLGELAMRLRPENGRHVVIMANVRNVVQVVLDVSDESMKKESHKIAGAIKRAARMTGSVNTFLIVPDKKSAEDYKHHIANGVFVDIATSDGKTLRAESDIAIKNRPLKPRVLETVSEGGKYSASISDWIADQLIARELGLTTEQYTARRAKNSPGQLGLFGDGIGGDEPLRTASRQQKLDWDESRVKRDDEGKFATSAGGGASAKAEPTKNEHGAHVITPDDIGGGGDGTFDQLHAGLASEIVQSKIAIGMKGIEGREYAIMQTKGGKWQLASRAGEKDEVKPAKKSLEERFDINAAIQSGKTVADFKESVYDAFRNEEIDESEMQKMTGLIHPREYDNWNRSQKITGTLGYSRDYRGKLVFGEVQKPTVQNERVVQEVGGYKTSPDEIGHLGSFLADKLKKGVTFSADEPAARAVFEQAMDARKRGENIGNFLKENGFEDSKARLAFKRIFAKEIMDYTEPEPEKKEPSPGRKAAMEKSASRDNSKFNFDQHVKIAADDISKLRKSDVYRLIETVPDTDTAKMVADMIGQKRPDLKDEAMSSLFDYLQDAPTPGKYSASIADMVADRLIAAELGLTVEQYAARKKPQKGQQEFEWITVNADKGKGQPVMIDKKDGTILAGMGGKFDGQKIGEIGKGKGGDAKAGDAKAGDAKGDASRGKGEAKAKEKPLSEMTLAEKLKWQKENPGKGKIEMPKKPKPKTMVDVSGASYEFIENNKDGTIKVRNDQGDTFSTEQGEEWKMSDGSKSSADAPKGQSDKEKIADYLSKNPKATVGEISKATGIKGRKYGDTGDPMSYPLNKMLKEMNDSGEIESESSSMGSVSFSAKAKPAESPDKRIEDAIAAHGGHEATSADNVDAIRNSLYESGKKTPSHADIREAMQDMRNKAGEQRKPEAPSPGSKDRDAAIGKGLSIVDMTPHVLTPAQAEGQAADAWYRLNSEEREHFSGYKQFASEVGKAFAKRRTESKPAPAPAPYEPPTIPGQQTSLFGGDDLNTGQKSLFNMARPSKADQRAAKRGEAPPSASLLEQIDDEEAKRMDSRKSLPGQRDMFRAQFEAAMIEQYRAPAAKKSGDDKKSKRPKATIGNKGDRGRFITTENGDVVFLEGKMQADGNIDTSQAVARKRREKAKHTDPDRFVPVNDEDHEIVRMVGDKKKDVAYFKKHIDEAHREVGTRYREDADAMREVLAQFGYTGKKLSGFLSSLKRRRGDTSNIAGFDEMLDYAQKHHRQLLTARPGESAGAGDEESMFYERLKAGFPPAPKRSDPEVIQAARGMSGIDQTGLPSEWDAQEADAEPSEEWDDVPFSASPLAVTERYAATFSNAFKQTYRNLATLPS